MNLEGGTVQLITLLLKVLCHVTGGNSVFSLGKGNTDLRNKSLFSFLYILSQCQG